MITYAMVKKGTWILADTDIGPFDGCTLEAAEEEVVLTFCPELRGTRSAHDIIESAGVELVPITAAHYAQYARGT